MPQARLLPRSRADKLHAPATAAAQAIRLIAVFISQARRRPSLLHGHMPGYWHGHGYCVALTRLGAALVPRARLLPRSKASRYTPRLRPRLKLHG